MVLILIVVEDGLVQIMIDDKKIEEAVLILVVVDDGLVRQKQIYSQFKTQSLNPCCSGQ